MGTAAGRGMKVGELARRAGVSIRTLHYYDQIGLLSPSEHTGAGHRLYSGGDIVRLQQIRSLQQFGLTLDEVRKALGTPGFSPLRVIEMHIGRINEQIEMQRRLCARLQVIANALRASGEASTDDLLTSIEEMKRMEKYYTPEQLEYLKKRRETLGDDYIHQVEAEWPQLIAKVRDAMDAGTPPSDPAVQAMARRWMELVKDFTGGDPGIEDSLRRGYQDDPTWGRSDMDPRMNEYMGYIQKALASE